MRRGKWVGPLMALVIGAGVFPGPTAAAEKELYIAGWTGRWETAFREGILNDFERECGCKVSWIPGLSAENVAKLRAQKDSPRFDVAILTDLPWLQAKNLGLLAPLDPKVVTNLGQVYDLARLPGNIGVGVGTMAAGIVYNEAVFREKGWRPPTSWKDLFRPEFKGRLAIPNITVTQGPLALVMFARLGGGDERRIDPGFQKMRELAPNVLEFFKGAGQLSELFQRNEVWVAVWDNASMGQLAATGFPVRFVAAPEEGNPFSLVTWNVVRGAPHAALAQQFVNYTLTSKAQALVARDVFVGPLSKQVRLTPEEAARVVYGPGQIQKLVKLDLEEIVRQRAAWTERWNKEILSR